MPSSKKKTNAPEVMVVNDSPGEECRIAILQDGHLDELYTERTATATNVGNIYKGRVTNVEPAIQAAFVDYGKGQAGFLHISDLHPRYFPGAKRTERVGKKIPRRARPPIQEALRKGDEVLVQVLKEGIGTKGPTLTSYLSVPGRLLVMMPDMDRVGVSRKVEDPDRRRKMRQILDSLDLPDGFGFILRTAGFDKNKTELNRDVAFLMRLWKVMDKRIKDVGAPCELYTESDLFVRTIRDVLRPTIEAIVVDSESAYERARALLRVVAPRGSTRLVRYRSGVPIFHAFDVERQIDLIHEREVPLPSGGKLVIDQTEALVAIDVNSGRSRRARDSETNAFETNCEAVDEICRQLRLRDLGGLVINDLIDMHAARHRREIEDRFKQGLARDRAKTTMLKISEFGIVELTRQRMRPSLRKAHFMSCAHCDGRGEIKTPESVGADAARQAGYLLQFDRVRRVEMVCSPRVASVLLSSKRRELVELEDDAGKKIDVRVSDAIAADRVDFYAYDERNADIDIEKLPAPRPPIIAELEAADTRREAEPDQAEPADDQPRKRRRRRRGAADATAMALAVSAESEDLESEEIEAEPEKADARPARTGRKRRRRSKGAEKATEPETKVASIRVHELARELGVASRDIILRCREKRPGLVKNHMSAITGDDVGLIRGWFAGKDGEEAPSPEGGRKRKRTRSRRRRGEKPKTGETPKTGEPAAERTPEPEQEPRRKKKSRRRRKKSEPAAAAARNGEHAEPGPGTVDEPKQPAGRALYRSRRRLSRTEAKQMLETTDT